MGRLQNQHEIASARLSFNDGAGCGAPDLLVRGEKKNDFFLYGNALRLESLQSEQPAHNPRFHVEHPGTISPASLQAERHSVNGAQVPDRVQVSQQEDLAGRWPRIEAKLRPKMLARLPRTVISNMTVHATGYIAHHLAEAVQGRFVRA